MWYVKLCVVGSIPTGPSIKMRGYNHPISVKERCLDFRKRGFSYNQIVKATRIPKTTIQNWVFDIKLSIKAKKCIQGRIAQGIVKGNQSSKRKTLKIIPQINKWTKKLVFIIAHFMFDGGGRIDGYTYYSKDISQINRMRKMMLKVFKFRPHTSFSYNDVIRDTYFSRSLVKFVDKKKKEMVSYIKKSPKKHKRCFLKAFFDDEGSVRFDQKYGNRKVRGFQDSSKLLELIKKLLSDFGIKSRIESKNEIVISNKQSIIKFQKEINFSPKIFFNSKRRNSIWKKDVEKRVVLTKMIKSYF
ncbi:MAG: hypothetical protein CEN92_23 [Candidatus Berkelbacteria bacterium Licking1014_96]|uniref:DOD-type homing endonuclease domain-containing protein n=1 Tax=Candidatus Berkelbacteria bacterium Licking1014_96 TaxID=2017149 RepID=A0A554LHH1_9BACT|nr:MAG: hypothetical protein CEN92_23 [Candidatus Berkelbacteria bacterium Licking1014_96]